MEHWGRRRGRGRGGRRGPRWVPRWALLDGIDPLPSWGVPGSSLPRGGTPLLLPNRRHGGEGCPRLGAEHTGPESRRSRQGGYGPPCTAHAPQSRPPQKERHGEMKAFRRMAVEWRRREGGMGGGFVTGAATLSLRCLWPLLQGRKRPSTMKLNEGVMESRDEAGISSFPAASGNGQVGNLSLALARKPRPRLRNPDRLEECIHPVLADHRLP